MKKLIPIVALGLAACLRLPPPGGPDVVRSSFQFLFKPDGDPASLLGRRMMRLDSGVWTIAEARDPGCIVEQHEEKPAEWTDTMRESAGRVVAVGADLGAVSARAEHAADLKVEYTISNKYALLGKLRGCGENAIITVNVGSGTRRVVQGKRNDIKAGATDRVEAHAGQHQDSDETVQWEVPQAWSVVPSQSSEQQIPFSLSLERPLLVNGEQVHAYVQPGKPSWLIAYSIEESGRVELWSPSQHAPVLKADGERWTMIPPMEAYLRDPRKSTIDTLVVYGFYDERDFIAIQPDGGFMSDADALSYVARLDKYAKGLPPDRYGSKKQSYRITPKPEDVPSSR